MSGWALPESLYVSGCWSIGVYKHTSCLRDIIDAWWGCRDGPDMAHNA